MGDLVSAVVKHDPDHVGQGEPGWPLHPGRKEPRWQRLVSIITLRNRRIFQLSTYHELQLDEISSLVHFFFIKVKVRFLNSVLKFAEAEWGVSRSRVRRGTGRQSLACADAPPSRAGLRCLEILLERF